jgi:hypothetical protein
MPRPRPGKLIDFGPLLIVLFSKTLFHRRNSPSKRLGFFPTSEVIVAATLREWSQLSKRR